MNMRSGTGNKHKRHPKASIKSSLPFQTKEVQAPEQWQEVLEDDPPIRGTRPLYDIYQRCNVAICEPAGYEEAIKDQKWNKAMEEEMSMIKKKQDLGTC